MESDPIARNPIAQTGIASWLVRDGKLVGAMAILAALVLWIGHPLRAAADTATAIAAGSEHTCAITSAGALQCWGSNGLGQLGDGTTTSRSTPGDVIGLTSDVTAVAAGSFHTCAITGAGGLQCWGSNLFGRLGDGTTTNRSAPVDVIGLTSDVTAVAAGQFHTCAVTGAGGVKCWGRNDSGQLGDGTTTDRDTPVDVVGLSTGVVAVAAGGWHTCALTSTGGLKCWGYNEYGQLGNGTTVDVPVPGDVLGMSIGVTAVATGAMHTCAITLTGGLQCWGYNGVGALGDGTTTNRSTPVDVIGLTSGVTAVDASVGHTCAVTDAGSLECWGGNFYGQLGDGTTTTRSTPGEVFGPTSGSSAVAAGGAHTCAITSAYGVMCWGNNSHGELGNDLGPSQVTPVTVVPEPALLRSLASGVALLAALARRRSRGHSPAAQRGQSLVRQRAASIALTTWR